MIFRPAVMLGLMLASGVGAAQTGGGLVLPAGTPFAVQVDEALPMRVGTPVRARLLYPVYAGNRLLVPEKSVLVGSIVALRPDGARRVHARLNLDFTPFHVPVVRFTQVVLADGTALALASGDATDGAPIFRIVAPPPETDGFVRRQMKAVVAGAKDRLQVVTGPDKGDRLKQFLYSQLPYHPERVAKGTAWTVESTEPLTVAERQVPVVATAPGVAAKATEGAPTWLVQAYLSETVSSESSKVGETVRATVAEPIYNADGTVAVPQGATLMGAVTKAKPARRLGRAGTLSFSFRQLDLPDGATTSVQASLKGADAATAAELAMDSEGEVKPKPRDKLVVPLILLALAAGPLDRDGGRDRFRKDALASNSLGFLGFVVGVAARKPNIAAGIGYYGAALAIYERIVAKGKAVSFPRDTRIVVQTTARRSAAMKPDAASR